MTFRLQWPNSTTPRTPRQITVKIYWLTGALTSLSLLRFKTAFPFHFEGFLLSLFKNNDSHFCHLVKGKQEKPLLSAWLGVSPVTAKVSCQFCLIHSYAHIFTRTLLPRKQYFVQDTGGTAEILYHSNTKQKKAQDDFRQSQLFLLQDGLSRKFTFQHINMIGSWKATMSICWHRKHFLFSTRAAHTCQTQIHKTHPCMRAHNFSKCFTEAAKGSHVLDIVWYVSKNNKKGKCNTIWNNDNNFKIIFRLTLKIVTNHNWIRVKAH